MTPTDKPAPAPGSNREAIAGPPLRAVALIPARSGSRRIPGKNVRVLGGHPLLAYSIAAARTSGVFADVVVSADCDEYRRIAEHYGATAPFARPGELAGDLSPDIEWVEHALSELGSRGCTYDCFCLLRPTSPFRRAHTIRRAWQEFTSDPGVDSLRAVEKCSEHPGKMWVIRGERMTPLLPFVERQAPWHSLPYAALPLVHVQNASLEIAWTRVVSATRTISGHVLRPFLTRDEEGFDLNRPIDWTIAEEMVRADPTLLPVVSQPPYAG